MPNIIAVVARFDDETDKKLTELKTKFTGWKYNESAPFFPPHITIAAYDDNISIDDLYSWTEEFVKNHTAFTIIFPSLGIFPPGGDKTETAVIYAAPASSKNLIDFYYGFHEKFDEYCGELGRLYSAKFGFPAIHSTIGIFATKDLQNALEIIFASQIFGEAKINALEIYAFPNPKLLKRFEL